MDRAMIHEPNATPRRTPPRRGFRVADAMILVAAVATGLALSGWVAAETRGYATWWNLTKLLAANHAFAVQNPGLGLTWASTLRKGVRYLIFLSVPYLTTFTLALIPMRLLAPRPRWRRLVLQPGTVTAFDTVLACVFVGLECAVLRLAVGDMNLLVWYMLHALRFLPVFVCLSIVSTWTMLIIARRWRADPSWIDRLGRAAAFFWLSFGFFNACDYLVDHFVADLIF
jgi:hypothetical protein